MKLNNKLLLPTLLIFAGIISIVIGIVFISINLIDNSFNIFKIITGVLLLIIGSIITFSTYGIEISETNNKIRKFTTILGITFGKFKTINNYSQISIVKKNYRYKLSGRSNAGIIVSKNKYNVCLFNETFRKKFIVKICDSYKDAVEFSDKLAFIIKIEVTKFTPPVKKRKATISS